MLTVGGCVWLLIYNGIELQPIKRMNLSYRDAMRNKAYSHKYKKVNSLFEE